MCDDCGCCSGCGSDDGNDEEEICDDCGMSLNECVCGDEEEEE